MNVFGTYPEPNKAQSYTLDICLALPGGNSDPLVFVPDVRLSHETYKNWVFGVRGFSFVKETLQVSLFGLDNVKLDTVSVTIGAGDFTIVMFNEAYTPAKYPPSVTRGWSVEVDYPAEPATTNIFFM